MPICNGSATDRETLEVLFKGKSIADVLACSVEEGADSPRLPASARSA